MTASIQSAEDESRDIPAAEGGADQPSATTPLAAERAGSSSTVSLMSGTGDRCSVCSAELAQDQRYCVECGTRRGGARFTLPARRPESTTAVVTASEPWFGGRNTVLLATIVVLLALGVGVLIGNSGGQTVRVVGVSGSAAAQTKASTTSGKSSGATKPQKAPNNGNFFGS